MFRRLLITGLLIGSLTSLASAQVVRFETSVGEFDMVLNPTDNPLLQGYVDNFVQYVDASRFNCVVINRADEGFVLQMGGFLSSTLRPGMTVDSFRPVQTFDPVDGVPAATIDGLSNTIGTVALALPGDGMGGTDQDAGTSSFFVNLGDNSFLDPDFTVFAAISDMTTIDTIMGLSQVDLTQDPDFGAGPGNLAFTDVPLQDNGRLVFIQRAFILEDAMAAAAAIAGVANGLAASSSPSETFPAPPELSLSASAVPEPGSCMLALLGMLGLVAVKIRRGRK